MKKLFNFRLLVLIGVLIMSVSQMQADCGTGMGVSYIFFENNGSTTPYWYNCSGTGNHALSDGLGEVYSIKIGAQVQTWGQSKATDNPAQIWYKFDSNSFAWLVNLCYWKYESNNNWFQSGCSTADADQTLDISSLTPGNHTLSVYFKIKDCDKYDSNGGSNYSITFIKMPKVTFNANGGSVSTSEQYVSYNSSTALSSITTLGLNPPTGYHFDHWTDGGNTYSDGESVTLTTNITLTAIYEPNVYDITYLDCNSTSFSGTHDTGYPTTHTYNTSTTLYDATKIGYTFGGWYADSDCSGDEITSLGATAYTSNITLYAKWVATITLDENGGSTPGSATTLFNSDADLDISAPSHATGYYILGYYEDVECTTTLVADADGKLESDVSGFTSGGKWVATENKTLYTKWSNQYTITFEQGTPTIQGTDNTIATYGSAMPAVTVPSKTGYIFGGYWTGENGTGTKYYNANGTSANNWTEDENVNSTLYAQWTGIRYQVAFDANEGTGSMDNQDFTYGPDDDATNENLSQNNDYITREGYYFLGWNTRADGTGTKFYDQKPVRNLTTVDGGIVTLYAQWAKTYTLYFLNIKTDGWQNVSGNQESTNRYAYAFIYYDEHKLEPLGSYSAGTSQGTRMTTSSSIYLPNVGTSPTAWCWSIADVPEGATIIFSDNTDGNKTGDLSGWTPSKPYYCKGNNTWYTTDGENTISQMTNMSVHIGAGDFASWKYVGIDKHEDGSDYAIIWLNRDKTYEFKFSNWYQGGESGSVNGYSIIDGGSTKADYGGEPRTLESTYNVKVNTNTHASGQYKFVLTGWSGDKPQTRVYVPRGVNLTTTSPTSATAGETVTVSFTADAWTNLEYGTDMDNPTYYFEFSKDNSNWSTIATYSAPSAKHATASYTFEAQSGYFRVKLVNDHGLASYSGSTEFTAYSTKSFYVYNPYNTSGNWSYLHLYTWDSNNGNARYNGDFPTGSEENDCGYVHGVDNAEPINCKNGNNIEYMGQNWFYITIDERANCFMLVGEATYKDHQTVTCYVNNYIPDAKYMIYTYENANYVKEYNAKSTSDYRLKYTYVVDEETKERYSPIYNTLLDNTLVEKTTVITSMWMDPRDASAKLIVEQGASDGSWSTVTTFDNNGSDDFDGLLTSAKRTKGDVFRMDLQFNPGPPASATISNVAVNNGPFYVRTDALDGGWNVYKKADHMLYVNENTSADYNYYLCKWIGTSGTNVKFTIADDYNTELVESYGKEPNASDPLYNRETLPATANVRFSWNSEENTLSRAYLSGSTNASDRFLVLVETTSPSKGLIYDSEGRTITEAGGGKVSGLGDYELIFKDNGNWVYQVVIQANPNAEKYNTTFDVWQQISGLPNGIYRITAQGFYRYGRTAYQAYLNHEEYTTKETCPVFVYMNANMTPFTNVYGDPMQITDETFYSSNSTDYTSETLEDGTVLYFPNGMASAAIAFENGMYTHGVKGSSNQLGDSWSIWDNFKITYQAFDAEVVKPVLEQAIIDAEANLNSAIGKDVAEALQAAIDEAKAVVNGTDGDAMFEALTKLFDLQEAVTESKALFAKLEAANEQLAQAILNAVANVATINEAKALNQAITDGLDNHSYKDTEVDDLINQIKKMINRLGIPQNMESASDASPVECTTVIVNPAYVDGNDNGWTGGAAVNAAANDAEKFNTTFNYYQLLQGLPAGTYKVSVQGFFRYGGYVNDYTTWTEDPTANNNAFLYAAVDADTVSTPMHRLASQAVTLEALSDGWVWASEENHLAVPNSMATAADAFQSPGSDGAPMFSNNNVIVKVGEDGNLTIGLKKNINFTDDWCIWTNWQLFYYGKNSTLQPSDNPLSIDEINGLGVVSAEFFTVDGARVSGIQRGITIVRETLTDGTTRVRKVTIK